MALEKKRGKEEAGLINRYKVFAKMQTAEDFEVLVDGLICKFVVSNEVPEITVPRADYERVCADEQTLRKKIAELQDYRRNGITSIADASRFDRLRNERVCH